MTKYEFNVDQASSGQRVDLFLSKNLPNYSRAYLQKMVHDSRVYVNGKGTKPSRILSNGDLVEAEIIDQVQTGQHQGEDLPLKIIFENENVIVINKQSGMVVHPASSNQTGTLINALIHHFPDIKKAVYNQKSEISRARPGLVHRLDKDTSGIMIVAKNKRSMRSLAKQIQNRTAQKTYLALCFGWPKNESGHLVNFIGRHPRDRIRMAEVGEEKGREAISDFHVINYLLTENEQKISLIEFSIQTGRTHQIRLQASLMHHPVLGDRVYGSKDSIKLSGTLSINRQLLHAYRLKIYLPGDKIGSTFIADLSKDFKAVLDKSSVQN